MSIKLAAWNVQEHLAEPLRSRPIIEGVKRIDADVAILSDAMWLGNPLHGADLEVACDALDAFSREGYQSVCVDYGDRPDHWPDRYLLALSRLESEWDIVRLGMYKGIDLRVRDPAVEDPRQELRVIGAHFDDDSEHNRLAQAWAVVNLTREACSENQPTVLAGDLNAMHGDSWRARLLRSRPARGLAARLPDDPPRNEYEQAHPQRAKAKRLVEMADGSVLRTLIESEGAWFHDADSQWSPTAPARLPLVQIDHVMVRGLLRAINFRVHRLKGSDHLLISVDISL